MSFLSHRLDHTLGATHIDSRPGESLGQDRADIEPVVLSVQQQALAQQTDEFVQVDRLFGSAHSVVEDKRAPCSQKRVLCSGLQN